MRIRERGQQGEVVGIDDNGVLAGQTVQGIMMKERPAEGPPLYKAVDCAACRLPHLVNVATLRLLSEERER